MPSYYFTFGSDERYPYQGGWVEVLADNLFEAQKKFKAKYPNRPGSCYLNCADFYTHSAMWASGMLEKGNRGAFCHEVIE